MNKVCLMGRLTRDPDVRYSQGENSLAIARYTLAVDRRFARRDDPNAQTADFISCKAFGKAAEFVQKYLHKGTKVAVSGRIETGSYTNKDGVKVYTTEVVVDEHEFAESKNAGGDSYAGAGASYGGNASFGGDASFGAGAPYAGAPVPEAPAAAGDGFMNIPDGLDEELPFA